MTKTKYNIMMIISSFAGWATGAIIGVAIFRIFM